MSVTPMRLRPGACVLFAFLALTAAWGAAASDGVLEVNQACAAGPGCFPGDTPGYPVTVTAPGSYRLTSDLTVPSANTDGIRLLTGDVTIDLNGFAVRGASVCSGVPLSCTATGSGIGIRASGRDRVTLRNGAIDGMGDRALMTGRGALVLDVRLSNNGYFSSVGPASTVAGCTLMRNLEGGLFASDHSTVGDCAASENGHGFSVLEGAVILRSSASRNDDHGFIAAEGSVISEATSFANGGFGLDPNTAVVSRAASHSNLHGAFVYTGGDAFSQLTVRSSANWGLDFGTSSDSGYGTTVISGNPLGTVGNDGVALDHELCNGSTTCP